MFYLEILVMSVRTYFFKNASLMTGRSYVLFLGISLVDNKARCRTLLDRSGITYPDGAVLVQAII